MPYSKPNAKIIASEGFCFNGSLNERITGIGSKIIMSVAILIAALVNHSGVVGRHLPCTVLSQLRAMGTQFNRGEKKPDSRNRGSNNLGIAEFPNFSNVKDSKTLQQDRNLGECEARSIHDNSCIRNLRAVSSSHNVSRDCVHIAFANCIIVSCERVQICLPNADSASKESKFKSLVGWQSWILTNAHGHCVSE